MSYARSDREHVQSIATELRDAGFRVWDPDFEILPGSDWTGELKSGLESSDAMLVFVSPRAMESRDVSHEIEYALGAKRLSGRLIPVVIRPAKNAPWILDSLQPIRYQSARETGREIIEVLSQPAHVPQFKARPN